MRWNPQNVLDAISALQRDGTDLSFNAVQEHHLGLLRAATRHHGSWKTAVELAGTPYEAVSRYKRWTRARVLGAIREHHRAGRDLSWRALAHSVDPSLAAAALRPGVGFETWREAVAAAGVAPERVARYQHWTPERVTSEIQRLSQRQEPLSSQAVQRANPPLFCAARRRFGTWNGALEAAGIDPKSVSLRGPSRAAKPPEPLPSKTQKAVSKTRVELPKSR